MVQIILLCHLQTNIVFPFFWLLLGNFGIPSQTEHVVNFRINTCLNPHCVKSGCMSAAKNYRASIIYTNTSSNTLTENCQKDIFHSRFKGKVEEASFPLESMILIYRSFSLMLYCHWFSIQVDKMQSAEAIKHQNMQSYYLAC